MITKRWLCCGVLVATCVFVLRLNFHQDTTLVGVKTQFNTTGVERKLIILLTEGRSGSTWLGTMFQQLDDLLYVFEPLDPRYANIDPRRYALAELSETGGLSSESQLRILASLCTCSFVGSIQAFGKAGAGQNVRSSITSYDLARHAIKGPLHIEAFCSQYTQVMAKCIRLLDLSILQDLRQRQCSNFIVIHLVRDPRAVIRSRLVTFHELYAGNGPRVDLKNMTEDDVRLAAEVLCKHGVQNHLTAQEPWLNGRYMRVKYEDLVADPHGTVEGLYRFIKRPISTALSGYIARSTNGTDTGSNYMVIKNSKAVADKWKNMIPSRVTAVEEACREFMQIYGYQTFTRGAR